MSGQTPITCIIVRINTADIDDAGTDADVYVGIGGREFYIDYVGDVPQDDDFEKGSDRGYILGEYTGPSLPHPPTDYVHSYEDSDFPGGNDPRSPYPMYVEDLGYFPIYVRSTGHYQRQKPNHVHVDDYWTLGYISITVNPTTDNIVFEDLGGDRTLTFGRNWGYILYLKNTPGVIGARQSSS